MDIAVLIPCYNEETTIRKVIVDFKRELPEAKIYVYDNNSTDETCRIAEESGAIVKKEFNQGKGFVVRSMFAEIQADVFIMIDGDDTYPVEEISKLLEVFTKKNADLVVGDRLANNSYFEENKRPLHNFGNVLVRKSINLLFNTKLNDIMSGYRVFSKRFVECYPVIHGNFEIETDMTIFALHHRLNIEEVPITFRDRPEGSESKLNTFKDGFKVLFTIFNMFRFYKPLSFFSIGFLALFLMGIIIGLPVVKEYMQYQYVYKVPSAILAVGMILLSILLFTCGLILDAIVNNEKKSFEILLKKKP